MRSHAQPGMAVMRYPSCSPLNWFGDSLTSLYRTISQPRFAAILGIGIMFSLRRYLGRSAALSRRAAAMTFLSSTEAWARLLRRLLKFHMVGVIGIGVQLCFLFAFRTVMHFNYLLATALAVECAVLHNFLWHEHYTWRDRTNGRRLQRLLRFNLSTGLISIVGNLVLMRLLVGSLHLQYMAANILSIGACSLLNFWASDQVVFQAELAPKE